MTPLPRGVCPFCRGDVAVRRNGLVREHKTPGGVNVRGVCPGSAKPPLGDQWVVVTASVTVAVAEHRGDDALRDAEELVADAIHPKVRAITDWDNRFVIATAFSTSAERIPEPADAYGGGTAE